MHDKGDWLRSGGKGGRDGLVDGLGGEFTRREGRFVNLCISRGSSVAPNLTSPMSDLKAGTSPSTGPSCALFRFATGNHVEFAMRVDGGP